MLGGVGPFFAGGPRTTVLSMSDWLGSAAGVGSLAKNMFNPGSVFTESAMLDATLITILLGLSGLRWACKYHYPSVLSNILMGYETWPSREAAKW
jgi:hypothetical protein